MVVPRTHFAKSTCTDKASTVVAAYCSHMDPPLVVVVVVFGGGGGARSATYIHRP